MKHYPKTPEEQDANGRVGAVCLFLGLFVFFLFKSCGAYDKKYSHVITTETYARN
jgi:hypothetical protein